MKKASRILALLLALVLTLGLSVTAFAAEETGTITISNAVPGQTYTIYMILDLESYNETAGAYAYKATAEWEKFLKENATDYVKVDGQGYVTWEAAEDEATVALFAKAALEYAKGNENVKATDAKTASGNTVTFTDLPLGYYLVDSTLGTLCSLNTTKPNVTINEKNAEPTNVKTVEEDSHPGTYGRENDADIGQAVNFKSTITAQAGAQNYVFHDKMSEGLTFGEVTGITLNGNTVDSANYTVKAENFTDDCTFEVVFTQTFCDTLNADDKIVISYTATLNEKAKIGNEGNPNTSKISYGEEGKSESTPSTTTTYTWSFKVFKYHVVGDEKMPLAGAKFTLSKNENGTPSIALVKVNDNVYRVAKDGEPNTVTEITTDATGEFEIRGLDSDTYYLTETAAPSGYNKLAGPVKVVIGSDGKINVTENNPNGEGMIKVENKSGAELPSTGGMGTTIFYVLGGILAVGAVILLVTKKRVERS